MNVLVDTNVILDAMMPRDPFSEAAQEIFILAAKDKVAAYITANCVTDIYYLLHKHLHSATAARDALSKLFRIFKILDLTAADCEDSLLLAISDYEDALLIACATRCKIECIITRNLKDFTGSIVPVQSPDDFLKSMQ